MRIEISQPAKLDLAQILAYLEQRSPKAARRLSDDLESAILRLGEFPLMGRERPEFGSGQRSLVAQNSVIFDRVEPAFVLILRVLDGRMDVENELLR
jgi:toxin ParE1/3/4